MESLQEVLNAPLEADQIIIIEPSAPIDTVTAHVQAEVIAGPFTGHVGYVQSTTKSRGMLLMNILGAQVPVRFKLSNLRKITDKSNGTQEDTYASAAD